MDDLNASSSCDLGLKEYWVNFYLKELENFEEYGDEGDIWFGKKNVERIVSWILENDIDKHLPILDVGCGNGMTLVSLGRNGYEDLNGIDYVREAVQLAENVARMHDTDIKFQALDFLEDDESSDVLKREYHVIIDKGTYDAVCLVPNDATSKRLKYVEKIKKLLKSDGYFILFSCNWTKEELLSQFIGFTVYDEIKIPSFGFGGKSGQTVTALILKKVIDIICI